MSDVVLTVEIRVRFLVWMGRLFPETVRALARDLGGGAAAALRN